MNVKDIDLKLNSIVGNTTNKYLLAISGGADSVALLDVCNSLGYDFIIAHCNFNLRGEESLRDEMYVRELAKKYNKPIYVISFDTLNYAEVNNCSIEMAARDLRYNWFDNLLNEHDCEYILVAHHMGDVVETALINLIRGTGIKGLKGIAPINDKVVRPLLDYSKDDILKYLKDREIDFCDDSSNFETDYTRNKIRLNIIPEFEKINPSFKKTMYENTKRFSEIEILFNERVQEILDDITSYKDDKILISIEKLKKASAKNTVLYELLKSYGFNNLLVEEIIASLDSLSGKYFDSKSHRLVKDRNSLILYELSDFSNAEYVFDSSIDFPINIEMNICSAKDYSIKRDKNIVCFDAEKVKMPLNLRKWRQGDFFFPFGMKGRKKKLSDFFADNKFSLKDKEDCWLVCSEDKILWIVGYRGDDKAKITDSTINVLELKCGF